MTAPRIIEHGDIAQRTGAPQTEFNSACRTLAQWLADPSLTASPPPIIPQLAYAGRVTLLSSREKMGKSTFIGQAAAAASSGTPFLGHLLHPVRVLWIAIDEHVGDTLRRLQAMGANTETVLVAHIRPALDELQRAVKDFGVQLVVVDTLSRLWANAGVDENDANTVLPFMHRLSDIARSTDAAVVLCHHTGKAGRDYRGSTAIGGAVDAPLTFRATGDDGRLLREDGDESDLPTGRRVSGMTRWGHVTLHARFDGERYVTASPVRLPLAERVLLTIGNSPTALSKAEVERRVEGRAQDVRDAIAAHITAGWIENTGSESRPQLRITAAGRVHAYPVPNPVPDGGAEFPDGTRAPNAFAARPGRVQSRPGAIADETLPFTVSSRPEIPAPFARDEIGGAVV